MHSARSICCLTKHHCSCFGIAGCLELQGNSRRLPRYLGHHSLALVLATEYLNVFCGGDASRIHEIPLINEETKAGRHAKSVMDAYKSRFEGTKKSSRSNC